MRTRSILAVLLLVTAAFGQKYEAAPENLDK